MKSAIICLVIVLIITATCSKNDELSGTDGLNFYLTKHPMHDDFRIDYDTFRIDTIALHSEPFLSYNTIKYLDTSEQAIIIGLRTSKYHIDFPGNTRMFVATFDNKPLFCGFLWDINISYGSNWIFIEDPEGTYDLKPDQLKMLFDSESRDNILTPELLKRLRRDFKLK